MNETLPPGAACPQCGSTHLGIAEDEAGHRSRDTIPLILLSALAVVGAYFLFLVYAYIAYPLTVMLFVAATGFILRRREKGETARPVTLRLFCRECNHLFIYKG